MSFHKNSIFSVLDKGVRLFPESVEMFQNNRLFRDLFTRRKDFLQKAFEMCLEGYFPPRGFFNVFFISSVASCFAVR